jgi:hypothetical protein
MARARHLDALSRAAAHVAAAREDVAQLELFAEELRLAQAALAEITGEFTADDLLGEIFSKFCIGNEQSHADLARHYDELRAIAGACCWPASSPCWRWRPRCRCRFCCADGRRGAAAPGQNGGGHRRVVSAAWHGPVLFIGAAALTVALRRPAILLNVAGTQLLAAGEEVVYRIRVRMLNRLSKIALAVRDGGRRTGDLAFVTDLNAIDSFLGASVSGLVCRC